MKGLYLVSCLVVLGLVLASLGACAASTPTTTVTPTLSPTSGAVSLAGKTITIVVGNAAGSSADITARVYAKYLSRLLPGNPIVVVRSMPGGGGTIAGNYVYFAKPDGLTILAGSSSHQLNQLVGASAVHYDLLKMPLLVATSTSVVIFTNPKIVDKPEDILKAKGIIFGTSPGGFAYLFIAAKELLNIPTEKVVLAYSGNAEARRGFFSGELNMACEAAPAYNESVIQYVQKREVIPVFQSGIYDDKGNLVRSSGLPPDILTAKELYENLYGKTPSGIVWDVYQRIVSGRKNSTLWLPPETPDSILRSYWSACAAMVADPEFRKVADTLVGAGSLWGAGEALTREFKSSFALDPKVRDWLRTTMPKYGVVIE